MTARMRLVTGERQRLYPRRYGWHLLAGVHRFRFGRGADVNIIQSSAQTPKTDAAIKQAAYITIAVRKALTGDQSYRLPKDFDPSRYQSVGIWCEEFGVLFGAAQLQRISASSAGS